MREEVVDYTVGRMNVLRSWLDYRWANRDTRATRNPEVSSPLDAITHQTWPSVFDDDLLDILNVLTLLVDLEGDQADVLDAITDGRLLTRTTLDQDGSLRTAAINKRAKPKAARPRKGQLPGEQQLSEG